MTTNYFLHYIGKGLYDKERFILESEKIGINRAIPANLVGKMSWGQKILLAQYEPENRKNTVIDLVGEKREETVYEGKAVVFGYFPLSSLSFNCTEKPEFMGLLTARLNVTHHETYEVPMAVSRECGDYTLSGYSVVTDSVETIVEKAKLLAVELGVNAKVFVSGRFKQLALKEIKPVKFARSGMHIELDQPIEGEDIAEKRVNFIGNYNQRKYKLKTGKKRAKKAPAAAPESSEQVAKESQTDLNKYADEQNAAEAAAYKEGELPEGDDGSEERDV